MDAYCLCYCWRQACRRAQCDPESESCHEQELEEHEQQSSSGIGTGSRKLGSNSKSAGVDDVIGGDVVLLSPSVLLPEKNNLLQISMKFLSLLFLSCCSFSFSGCGGQLDGIKDGYDDMQSSGDGRIGTIVFCCPRCC